MINYFKNYISVRRLFDVIGRAPTPNGIIHCMLVKLTHVFIVLFTKPPDLKELKNKRYENIYKKIGLIIYCFGSNGR